MVCGRAAKDNLFNLRIVFLQVATGYQSAHAMAEQG